MRNILVTEVDGGDDVMVFTETLTVESITEHMNAKGLSFGEAYEVADHELEHYVYEPLWLEIK